MRRIRNSAELRKLVEVFNDELFKARQNNFVMPIQKLATLRKQKNKVKKYGLPNSKIVKYITKIESEYARILNADEREMKKLIREFDKIIPAEQVGVLHESIVDAMRYDDLREREVLDFLNQLSIKTCVYCHSQSTLIIVPKGARKLKALLQLDHKYPKSKYPFLCTSFYNLYPICSNCNLSKSSNHTSFELYTDDSLLDVLKFGLEKKSIVKYWQTRSFLDLKIQIKGLLKSKKKLEDYNKMFSIPEIYDQYKDVAEELVHKANVYNRAYKATLVGSFKELFPDQSMINRILIGNYDRPEDMLKRPLAKFVQEIARDVKLIPREENPNLT